MKKRNAVMSYDIFLNREIAHQELEIKACDLAKDSMLLLMYANYLHQQEQEPLIIEKYYKLSIEANPVNLLSLSYYGRFLYHNRKQYKKGQRFLRKAITIHEASSLKFDDSNYLEIKTISYDYEDYAEMLSLNPATSEKARKYQHFADSMKKGTTLPITQ
jgi:tetratricopeptide (TPR) repeat protein